MFFTKIYNIGELKMCAQENKLGFRVDLTGRQFGSLTVLEFSDKRGSRGNRTVPLWKCICDCGEITYKATDTLNSRKYVSCAKCAAKKASTRMRESAGFVDGTQVSRIKSNKLSSSNTSGARGVYFEKKTQKWRARLKFKGKLMNFGSFNNFEDAVKARRAAEELYFGEFLDD